MFIENFTYTPNYSAKFDVADGIHDCRIVKAEISQSQKTGKRFIKVEFDVAGANGIHYTHNIVESDFFQTFLSRFLDCFQIKAGNFQFNTWTGKVGKAEFKHKNNTFTDSQGVERTVNRAELDTFIAEPIGINNPGKPGTQGQIPQQMQRPQPNNLYPDAMTTDEYESGGAFQQDIPWQQNQQNTPVF